MPLSVFGLTTLWPPEVAVILSVVAAVYLIAVGPGSPNRWGPPATARQTLYFMTGLVLAWVGFGTPIHLIGEVYLLSAHMITTMVTTMLAPPLLILGTPAGVFDRLPCNRFVQPAFRMLTKPLVAFGLFNGLFLIWHSPQLFDAALKNDLVHLLQYATLFFGSFVGWWPLLSPLPALPRLPDALQMFYTFGSLVVQTLLFGPIMILDYPIYESYKHVPRLIQGLSVLEDQQAAHLFMGVLAPLVLGSVFTAAFFRLFGEDGRKSNRTSAG